MAGPFLIGRRVQIRPFEEDDAATVVDWFNDPAMREVLLMRFPKSIKDEKEWIASMSLKGTPRDMVFGVELRARKRLIGSIGMHAIDWVGRRAMTGIALYPPGVRGKGYGTEAKNLLLDYAFGELGMMSLWAIAIEGNQRSIGALEKQGYRRGGVFRRIASVRGRWVNGIYFDILREEWEALRGISKARRGRR